MAQNTFNINWRRLSVALGLYFLVDSLDMNELNIELSLNQIWDL